MLRAALADAPSRRFFLAHAQSYLGSGLVYVALPLLAYDRHDSVWAVVAVLLPELLPAIVLGPLLGRWWTGGDGACVRSSPTWCAAGRSRCCCSATGWG